MIVLAVLLAVSTSLLAGFPLIGVVAGAGGFARAAVGVGPLPAGAIIGGALA